VPPGCLTVVACLVFAAGGTPWLTDPHLAPDRAACRLVMQIGMLIGSASSVPAGIGLIRRGVEEAM
jgi:hypothetical protein